MASRVVHVLLEDPGLGEGLEERDVALATQHLAAAEVLVPLGDWRPGDRLGGTPGDLGYLILDGLALRETSIGRHVTAEILGAGDLLRPWDHRDSGSPIGSEHAWKVLEPLRLAVLDARFGALAGRFPTVTAVLVGRTLRRSRLLGILLAVSAMPRLDARLLTLRWHLAHPWGHVGTDGTTVPLPLTHAVLAQLVGAQRPSVTSALKGLEDRGLVTRAPDGPGWVLRGAPPGDPELVLEPPAGS